MIAFSGSMVEQETFSELIHDVALLNSLGIRLVLVHGARPQIEHRLQQHELDDEVVNGLRVTSAESLLQVKAAVGMIRSRIEGMLSTGLPNSPMSGADIRVVSGNFVVARPLGVREGVDYLYTGEVRRIDVAAIERLLDNGFIVLLSPLGSSPTGEVFNLSSEDVATAAAIQLQADKMVSLIDLPGPADVGGGLIRELDPDRAELLLGEQELDDLVARTLLGAIHACRSGVPRTHLLNGCEHGALLQELFTRDGVGTMVTSGRYDRIRPATIEDVGGIIRLIEPLEQEGILVSRSRELLEIEIDHFTVMERDGTVIGVVALYPYKQHRIAEIAGLAIDPLYQKQGRGAQLLHYIDQQLQQPQWHQIDRLFVLSTRTMHWFQEQGYEPAALADLPLERQSLYNYKRNSKVFIRALKGA